MRNLLAMGMFVLLAGCSESLAPVGVWQEGGDHMVACATVHNTDGIGGDVTTGGDLALSIDHYSPAGTVPVDAYNVEGLRIKVSAKSGPTCNMVSVKMLQIMISYSDIGNTGWYPSRLTVENRALGGAVGTVTASNPDIRNMVMVYEIANLMLLDAGKTNLLSFAVDTVGASKGDFMEVMLVGFVEWQAVGDLSTVRTVDDLPINGNRLAF